MNVAEIIKLNSNTEDTDLVTCNAQINGIQVKCFIDTGASATFINKFFFDELQSKNVHLPTTKLPTECEVTMGNKTKETIKEVVFIALSIDNSIYPTRALLIDSLPFEV